MAFCRNCGTQLQGDERFCVGCGTDVSAKPAAGASVAGTAGSAAAQPATVPVTKAPVANGSAATAQAVKAQAFQAQAVQAPVAQTVAAAPGPYATPGTIPIMVTMPPQAPAKRGGMMWVLVVLAVLVGGYFYIKPKPTPPPPPPPDPAALTKQQAFDAHWDDVYGFVQISNGKWTNHANVAIDSATLECDQYNTYGTDLAQMRTTLNGPLNPGATSSYNPFQMGAVATNVNRVTCTIVHVRPVGSGQ
jgi:zinc-ribbon domain